MHDPLARASTDTVRARLRDGGAAALRPLVAGETGPLEDVFAGMSQDSRAMRYLGGMPRLSPPLTAVLTDVDGDRHVAWLACVDGHPAGIARYVRAAHDWSTAELAFEVVDSQHGRGLATVLMDALTTVASVNGVRRIRGTLLPDNVASRRLLARFGAVARLDDGLLEVEGPLRLLDPPLVDRAAVVRLAALTRVDDRAGCLGSA